MKTRRGKIYRGTFGKSRPKHKASPKTASARGASAGRK